MAEFVSKFGRRERVRFVCREGGEKLLDLFVVDELAPRICREKFVEIEGRVDFFVVARKIDSLF